MRFAHTCPLLAPLFLLACGPGKNIGPPSSILIITVDTLRADRLGCYGYKRASTPHIDGLADRGVRFETTFSVAPLTFPSHVSLFTGTIPAHHGVRDNGMFQAAPELLTLAEILSAEGLRTAAFTAAFVLDSQFGLAQGFEVYGDVPHAKLDSSDVVEHRPSASVNREAFAWLDSLKPDDEAFLWVHYFEPHRPYPPASALPAGFAGRPYDAEVATADRAVGKLLAHLAKLGRTERTLVVFASDHGESLGEHLEETHGFFVYQSTIHVPLIFAHGSLNGGTVHSLNVSLVDVMPTVLELLELESPSLPPPGRSLAGLFRGEEIPAALIYFECLNSELNYGWAPLQGVVVADHKLISVPRPELYDLSEDPHEERNLHDELPGIAASLDSELRRLVEENDWPELRESAQRELTPDDRVKLASLGYTGTASEAPDTETLADPKDGIHRIRKEESIRGLFEEGRLEEVESLMGELLAEDPNNGLFNSHYGTSFLIQRRFDEALPYLQRSVELGFGTADNLSNLGICQLFTDRIDDARKTLDKALQVDSKHLTSLFWSAQVRLRVGELEAAQRYLETFLGLWAGGEHPMVQQAKALLARLNG